MSELWDSEDYVDSIAPEPMWTTRDGTTLPIRQMTQAHLLNAFQCVVHSDAHQSGEVVVGAYYALKREILRRGLQWKLEGQEGWG